MPHYNAAFALHKITFGSYKDNVKSGNSPHYNAGYANVNSIVSVTLSL